MNNDKHQYLTSFNPKQQQTSSEHYDTDYIDKNIPSPKKKHIYTELSSKQAIIKTLENELTRQTNEKSIGQHLNGSNLKIKQLIIDAISSADRAIKAFLPYGHTEVQKYCSIYFLNKEKLYSYLDNHHLSFINHRESPIIKKKNKKKQEIPSELIQMVPINHLERLEKIVYNKIIPILKIQYEAQKKKSQKLIKKGKESNGDFKEGIKLLERLNQNQKVAVDQCAQILEKFIFKMMDREERMMSKLNKMQDKLDQEIKKTQLLMEESKQWEERRLKMDKQRKNYFKYHQFAKQIKSIFINKEKINQQLSEKQQFQEIIRQIKAYLNQQDKTLQKNDKKCEHKHKELHGSCKQQSSKNSKQIKNLKEVVKGLSTQNQHLRQQYQNMQSKFKNTSDLANKIQLEYKKRTEENLSMNSKIQQLISQQSYKNKLIQEYLRIIDRLEQSIKINEQTINKLNQENQGYLQLVTKHSNQKEDYVKHIIQIEEKQKELQEIIAKKQIQIQEILIQFYSKQKQVQQNQIIINNLNKLVQQKEQLIAANTKQNKKLKEQLETIQINKHKTVVIEEQPRQIIKIHHENIQREDKNNQISVINIQNYQNSNQILRQQQLQLRQTTLSISSKKYKQLKNKLKCLLKENGDLKFEIQRIKTFKALQKYNQQRENHHLSNQQKHQLKYLRNLIHNYVQNNKHQQDICIHQSLPHQQPNKQKIHEQNANNVPAFPIVQFNDAPLQQNKKGIQRQDFIPANINKQTIQQIKNYQESPIHRLNDQLDQINQDQNNQQIIQEQQPFPSIIKVKDQYLIEISKQLQIAPIQAQPSKIQQLVDLSERIGQNFIKLKQKFNQQSNLNEGLAEIQKQIDYMTSLLNIYKHNTLKKLQKIKKTELLRKQAEQQIQKLKKRLDDALIANQIQSTIQSNSQDSDFSLPQHLYSFFKQKNPFVSKHHFQSEADRHIKTKPSKQIYTQTQIPLQRRKIPGLSIQSELIIHHETPLMSQVQDMRLQNHYHKSFIHQLEAACIPNQHIESILNSQQLKLQTIPVSLKQTNHHEKQINPQNSFKRQSEIKQIGNLINYQKSSILNLNKLLSSQHNEQNKYQQNLHQNETPHRHPLQNESYMNYISNAPQRKREERQQHIIHNFNCQVEMSEMKQMFAQRQQEISQMLFQKDQEIQRLKSIIKTLTKTQEIENQLSTPRNSRHQEFINKQIQSLRGQNQNLWTLLIKQKSQIQHLRTLIKQYQIHQQIYKSIHSPRKDHSHQDKQLSIINNRSILNNQAFIFDATPRYNPGRQKEIEILQMQKQTKSQIMQHKQCSILLNSHQYFNQKIINQNQSQSPKRFTRKTEKFQRQLSPQHRQQHRSSKTSPTKTLHFDWQDLVPQYFGENKGQQSKNTQK